MDNINIDVDGTKDGKPINTNIEWVYPDIHDSDGNRSSITLGLMHVRSADDIKIEYSAMRDGWVIYQSPGMNEDETGTEIIWKEVAFIEAWALNPDG